MTMRNHEHGRPAEAEPDRTIHTQGVKMVSILLDPKLYSKVLRIYHHRDWIKSFAHLHSGMNFI